MRPAEAGRAETGYTDQDDLRVVVRILPPGAAARTARAVVREMLQSAGVEDGSIEDAEIVVAELAANCERHARQPYELRVLSLGLVPVWCEVVDGDPELDGVSRTLDRLRAGVCLRLPLDAAEVLEVESSRPERVGFESAGAEEVDTFSENGRGLLLAHQLSGGRCRVYATRTVITGVSGKAVAFGLPARPGEDLFLPHLVDASFTCHL
ncbi:ATP-binding protein [Sphaerisporangium sp. NPDC051017]|uniref:ATP-binding protein n=1 Tax=Sphaerisporangium sp. NPDC051017 TaxID=3154636 RepID=UPI00341BB09B